MAVSKSMNINGNAILEANLCLFNVSNVHVKPISDIVVGHEVQVLHSDFAKLRVQQLLKRIHFGVIRHLRVDKSFDIWSDTILGLLSMNPFLTPIHRSFERDPRGHSHFLVDSLAFHVVEEGLKLVGPVSIVFSLTKPQLWGVVIHELVLVHKRVIVDLDCEFFDSVGNLHYLGAICELEKRSI